jgi:PiT family inorganic phosphate transporter
MSPLLIASIGAVLLFAFTNGMKDGANVSATAIASGALSRFWAIVVVAAAELSGPYLTAVVLAPKVAATVSRGILDPGVLQHGDETLIMIVSGVIGALIWNGLAWAWKLPTSSSLTMVGGLIGPALYRYGWSAVPWSLFLFKVVLAMFLSPLVGLLAGFLVCRLLRALLANATPRANRLIRKAHIGTLVFLGANHGTNDSQKAMGIIALLLFAAGANDAMAVPFWVKAVSIIALAAGVVMGGTKIIKTVGYGIFRVRPLESLESQLGASVLLFACNLAGAPVSTTQLISASVMGAGSGVRARGVRWNLARTIVWSWIFTIPLAGLMSLPVFLILKAALLP